MSDRNFWLCYFAGFATTTSGELNLQDVDILSMKVPLDYLAGCCYQSLCADWVYGANSAELVGQVSTALFSYITLKILPASTMAAGTVVLTLILHLVVLTPTAAYLTDVF